MSPYHDNTPTTGFPEKIYSDGRVGGSAIDDDGAQYAIQRPVSYATSSGHYIIPPHSARTNESARPNVRVQEHMTDEHQQDFIYFTNGISW